MNGRTRRISDGNRRDDSERPSGLSAFHASDRALRVVAVKRAVEVHDDRVPRRGDARVNDRLGHRLVLDALGEIKTLGHCRRQRVRNGWSWTARGRMRLHRLHEPRVVVVARRADVLARRVASVRDSQCIERSKSPSPNR